MSEKVRGKLLQAGKTATGIEIPAKVVAALGGSKRPPVRATINGYTYRSSIAPMGGTFMLGVSEEVRKNAGVARGDVVEVTLELDTEVREGHCRPTLRRRSRATRAPGSSSRAFRTARSCGW
ncbi:MAG: DUF1905 domain-containing protein [Candidatus Dormiibacterota bacterium]